MQNLGIVISTILTLYTALGFVAHLKWDKFPYVAMITFVLCVLNILICVTWDESASMLASKLEKYPTQIIHEHKFDYIYSVLIPCITIIYIVILHFIFKPHTQDNTNNNQQ